ncbi:MAG TPA: hypothetical protein DCQ83_08220 [Fibrobacteres bacterium]|nr:hypothetical protein [Fibrobacterota bacterium]
MLGASCVFGQNAPARDSLASDTTAQNPPVISFLIPAEGDVFYVPELHVVARLQGLTSGTLIVLDGFSIPKLPQIENNVLSLDLSGLSEGIHEIRVLYLDSGKIATTPPVHFFVRLPEPKRDTVKGKFSQYGKVTARAEWRGEDAASRIVKQSPLVGVETVPETDTTWPYDTLVVGKGEAPFSKNLNAGMEVAYNFKYGHWEGYLNGELNSDENRFRQPANRFSSGVSYGPWAYVNVGDVYPSYSSLILNGTRLRGGEAGTALVTGDSGTHWVYAKVTGGESRREIPAYVVETDDGNGGYSVDYVPGTYSQNLSAFRLGVGGGENFDLGLTVMKTSEADEDSLHELFNEYLDGPRPGENVVTGIDSRLGLWQGRIQLYGQWALSLFTRDRSLGAFNIDSTAQSFEPADYEDFIVLNPTTVGWEYLLGDSTGHSDRRGFVDANSAYDAGVSTSIPVGGFVFETDASYNHLGIDYHSEGNPSLGGNPGEGWNLQQRISVLENRLKFGTEVSNFTQDLGDYRQVARSFKGDIRISPGAYRPAFWVNGGVTVQFPRGNAPYDYSQDFHELNIGGQYKFVAGPGTMNFSSQYGYTYSRLIVESSDSSVAPDDYPAVTMHVTTSSVQYRFRDSNLQPRVSYTYSDNGVQKSVHKGTGGVQDAFFSKKLLTNLNFLMGQYPKSTTRNAVSFGQNLTITWRSGEKQTVRMSEKWSKYGNRITLILGGNYERFF